MSLLPLRRLQLWKTLGKNVRLFQENKQIKHKREGAKMVLMMGGGENGLIDGGGGAKMV